MKTIVIVVFLHLQFMLHAQFAVGDYYHPVGLGESLVVQFNHSTEATTLSQYNGYLLLQFSGYGYNNPSELFDAFYAFSGPNPIFKQGLGIAFDGSTVLNGTQTLYEKDLGNDTGGLWQIVFNTDVGPYSGINRNGFPLFNPTHEYQIVLYINSDASRALNFGFLDGGINDNSGQVNMYITPVAIGAVPEPSVFALMTLGISTNFLRRVRFK